MKRRGIIALVVLLLLATQVVAVERMAVTTSVANVRSGPGTNYAVVWKMERYCPVLVQEKRGPWYRFVDYEQDSGWVHNSMLGKISTIITRKKVCNLRNGPGGSHEVILTVEDGIPFRVLEKKDHWIHVEHADGDKGWIHDSLVW